MLQSILHAAINVSNLATAEHFYGTVLGLTKVERTLKFAGAWYQLGSFQIHLIVAERDYSQPAPDEKWGRQAHLAFAITDLDVAKQRLKLAHIPMQASSSGRAAIFVQDPDGHVIELSQL
ncbi:glyoxalase [Leptolyngbyaceae cyanobacterium CCMR0082]|uniref:Glyoxalase n=2 Tax=Adonisia turfae TaxID=2950184 RepID=A0A6M0S5N8_9CYAN|nr:VOC family protein [Adonisia turfae]MDV3353510.1 VOC family protein [Leptothoe sp. LEGE 181152]NEZ56768.1 glyoxalase [Adonisia turfae CCMR0081]NEZ63777.1 glyoxalase [Adonisia turfae CCMR0082]